MSDKKTDRYGRLNISYPVKNPVRIEAPSARITNASMREAYVPAPWNLRPGAEDHKRFKSLERTT